jgi:hypothetical protein
MLRKKQVVLNLMVIVALFVSLVGVLPAGAASQPSTSRMVIDTDDTPPTPPKDADKGKD